MGKIKTSDKTTIKPLCWAGLSMFANTSAVDSLDGKIVRIRPVHFDQLFDVESSRPWKLEKNGHVLDQGKKSFISPFSIAYKKRTYSKNRIPYPMKRVDWDPKGERHPENRGKSQFERISWDEALDIVCSEIVRMHETYGHSAILCQGDGHNENKVYSGSHGNNIKMFSLLSEKSTFQMRNPDSWEGWYWGAEHAWGMEPVGQPIYCNNLFKDMMEYTDALFMWGGDPETTTWGWTGQQPSNILYWLTDIGIKQIYISPDLNYAGAIHADKWIPVLPNTDSAMQLAIAYVWMTEDSYDKEYIETHTVGFDWFEYYVLGEEDGVPKTPEWAEAKCGVPAFTIKALARYWAKHNCCIGHCNGGSYIRSAFSHEPARLEVYLLAMQALGHHGRNYVKFLDWTLFGMPSLYPLPCAEALPSLGSVYHGGGYWLDDSFIPKTLIPDALMNPPVSWYGHSFTGLPTRDQFYEFHFPWDETKSERIHMIWADNPCWETCWNGGFKMEDALVQPEIETYVIQHPWMEDECHFADILLPVSTILEEDDVAIEKDTGQFTFLYKSEAAVERQGEAISDFEIVWRIAKRLDEQYGDIYAGLFQNFTEGQEDYNYAMKIAYENSSLPEVNPDYTFEDFMNNKVGVVPTREDWSDDPAGMIQFYEDPENHPLTTPTGKIEFYSSALAHYFPDDHVRGPVAHWIESGDGHDDRFDSERAGKYPFLLVSNHPRWRFHAQNDDIPWIREIETSKVIGPDGYSYEPVWIHPSDAKKLGVETGDVVDLFNERGHVLGGAYVCERIMPGVVLQDHGSRTDIIKRGTGGLDRGGANNLLAPSPTTSKNCAGEVTSGYLVGVKKADPFALARQYPDEFNRAYDPGCGQMFDETKVKGA